MTQQAQPDDRIAALAAALRERSGRPQTGDIVEGWRSLAAEALADAGIELTNDQFDRAWRTLWQSSFMGGNFTLDAERILRSAEQSAVA